MHEMSPSTARASLDLATRITSPYHQPETMRPAIRSQGMPPKYFRAPLKIGQKRLNQFHEISSLK